MECRKGRGSGTGERGHDGCAGCYEEESGGVDGEGDVMGMDVRGEEEGWGWWGWLHDDTYFTRDSEMPGTMPPVVMGIHVVHIPSNGAK